MKLNTEQRSAAETFDRHILLLAPAGTGKTGTLAVRIANLIAAKRAMPEEILCLTFTNKACREMQARIAKTLDDPNEPVVIRTFHGFCYDVIRQEAKRHDIFADFTIFDETDCRALLREIAGPEWLPSSLFLLVTQLKETAARYDIPSTEGAAGYQKALSRLLEENEERVRALAIDDKYRFDSQLFAMWCGRGAALTAEYDARLHEMHALDFTDLIVRADELLRHEETAVRWRRRFSYIHIDEVQDTSGLEYRLIHRIFGSSRILLCGDAFQTIYEWRGSRPQTVLRAFREEFHPLEIALRRNYRATQTLLSASFSYLEAAFPAAVRDAYPEGIAPASAEQGEPILLKSAVDMDEEAQWIYTKIRRLDVKRFDEVCILTRSNGYNQRLSAYFESLNRLMPDPRGPLPFFLIDEMKFFRRQEIKDVLAFLRLIRNRNDTGSLVRIVGRFVPGVGKKTLEVLTGKRARACGLRLTDFLLTSVANRHEDPFDPLVDALAKGNVVVFDVESTGVSTVHDEIIQIAGIRLNARGEEIAVFKRELRPTKSVGDSVRVHHITDEELERCGEDPAQLLREFSAFARGAVIAGHNVTYDLSILASELSRLGLPPLDYPAYFDTLDIYRRFHPKLPQYTLAFLSDVFQVKNRSTHDALDDVRATSEILVQAVSRDIDPRREERAAFIGRFGSLFTRTAVLMERFRRQAPRLRPQELVGRIVNEAGIKVYYDAHNEEQRVENLRDFYRYVRDNDDESLSALDAIDCLLREATLSNTELEAQSRQPKIPVLTVHQAKGAEFRYVFLAGLQEGTFPSFAAKRDGHGEEEARLFYVAITRPREQLFLSWCQTRDSRTLRMSPFIRQIPERFLRRE